MAGPIHRRLSRGRSVDRLINFSDAVVAVAVTVLALPLIDIAGPADGQTIWNVIADNAGPLYSFMFTFFVVVVMWSAHNRILNEISSYDDRLFWLNTFWLVFVVLLPWVSALYGESSYGRSGVGVLYWSTLAVISILGGLMHRHIRSHPDLVDDPQPRTPGAERNAGLRGPAFAVTFLVIAAVSYFSPNVASWLPLVCIPLAIWLRDDSPVEE